MTQIDLGQAVVHPQHHLTAGSFTTLIFQYTAGHPIDDSGYVKVVFRFAGDFGVPQFEDPAAANFCSLQTVGDCRIEPRWDPKGHTRPWGRALFLKIRGRVGYFGHPPAKTIRPHGGSCDVNHPKQGRQPPFQSWVDPVAASECIDASPDGAGHGCRTS